MESPQRVLSCDCGFEARAEHEDELVAEIQRHAWEAHGMALSRDEVLLLASRAELGEKAPSVEAIGPQARTAPDNQRRKA